MEITGLNNKEKDGKIKTLNFQSEKKIMKQSDKEI
jgi:hypothetical protein